MKTIRDILQRKGGAHWSIASKATGYEALQVLADKDVGALLVIDDGRLVGIFSERDYARKVMLRGKSSRDTPVSALMTTDVLYANPDMVLDDCMALMSQKRVRHLPVMVEDQLVGVVSLGVVVSMIISEQKFTINELEKYITSSA